MIHLSEAAAKQIEYLVSKANYDDDIFVGLRIEVIAGGCAGYQYKFDMLTNESIDSDDILIRASDSEGLLCIDPMSAEKIDGATIDFESTIMSQQFVVKNPNANITCGCGISFQ